MSGALCTETIMRRPLQFNTECAWGVFRSCPWFLVPQDMLSSIELCIPWELSQNLRDFFCDLEVNCANRFSCEFCQFSISYSLQKRFLDVRRGRFPLSAATLAYYYSLTQSTGCAAESLNIGCLFVLEAPLRHSHADAPNKCLWVSGVLKLLPLSDPSDV